MNRRLLPSLALGSLFLGGLACSLPGVAAVGGNLSEAQTLEAVGTEAARSTAAAAETGGEDTAPQIDESGAATATATPLPPTATPTVVHLTIPSEPGSPHTFMTDPSSLALASEGRAIGDSYDRLLFERPFTSQAMEYVPWLDITRAEISSSAPWFYVTIFLEEGASADAAPFYGVEVDIDLDGRGDWLIWGEVPPDAEWTTDGMIALQDTNNDVGDDEAIQSDPPQAGDGYDEIIFDAGQGLDPDAAWMRRSPSDPSQVQIAFKQTLIGPPGTFLWGVWADEGPQEASWFDYNDHFTIEEAGSPVITTDYYPLEALARVDNSCRWGFGFEPTGSEPGVCYIPPTPTPTSPPPTNTPEPTPTNTPIPPPK